jgi:malonyl-CoA O-methyltransferase
MTRPSKARIRQSFERAAPTYDSAADIQRRICHRLIDMLPTVPAARLLDAGCGTGYALPLLRQRFPDAQLIGLDLSPAMLRHVAEPCCRLAADLEHLPLAAASIDLFWSSLAVQWCDLPLVLNEARRILRPGGTVALASLGPATFHELRRAFSGVDDYRHTLAFHETDEIRKMATQAGFSAIQLENHRQVAHYGDFKSLLRAVKAVGANQLGDGRRTSLMSRSLFQRAEAAYEAQRTRDGLPLTYDVITLIAQA